MKKYNLKTKQQLKMIFIIRHKQYKRTLNIRMFCLKKNKTYVHKKNKRNQQNKIPRNILELLKAKQNKAKFQVI